MHTKFKKKSACIWLYFCLHTCTSFIQRSCSSCYTLAVCLLCCRYTFTALLLHVRRAGSACECRLPISFWSWLLDMIAAARGNRHTPFKSSPLSAEVWTGALGMAGLVGSGSRGNSRRDASEQWWTIEIIHLKESTTKQSDWVSRVNAQNQNKLQGYSWLNWQSTHR